MSTMNISIRRTNLKLLTASSDSISAWARKYGFDATYVSQMLSGHRNIGEKTARKIEVSTGKPVGWLDGDWANPSMDSIARPYTMRQVLIKGITRLGDDGYYEDIDHGGWVDSYSNDKDAYGIRVKGDNMHPAIRNGSIIVVEPNGVCVPMEYVAIALSDGRKMIKELVAKRQQDVVLESVIGNRRQTIDRVDIIKIHPVTSIVSPSKWRAD